MTPLSRTWRPQTAPSARSTSSKSGAPTTSTQPLRRWAWCGGCQFHSATVNAWPPDGSYPIEATTLTDTAEFQGFSWGHGYEREMPLDTPAKEVADAVLATLPAQEKQSVPVS